MARQLAASLMSMFASAQYQGDVITPAIDRKNIRKDFINNHSEFKDKIKIINTDAIPSSSSSSSSGVTIYDFYPLKISNNSKHQCGGIANNITMYHNRYASIPTEASSAEDVNKAKNNFSSFISTWPKPDELVTASLFMFKKAKTFYNEQILRGIMYFLKRNKFDLLRQLFLDSDDSYVFVYGLRSLNDNKLSLDTDIVQLFDSDVSHTMTLEFTNVKPSYIGSQGNCVLYCIIESKLLYDPIVDNNLNGFDIDVSCLQSAELRRSNRRSVSILSRRRSSVCRKRKKEEDSDDDHSNSETEYTEAMSSMPRCRSSKKRSVSRVVNHSGSSSSRSRSRSPASPPKSSEYRRRRADSRRR